MDSDAQPQYCCTYDLYSLDRILTTYTMKSFLLILCLGIPLVAASQTSLRIKRDTVEVHEGELEIQSSTKNINGFLYNVAGGRTVFKKLGLNVQFITGDPGFPGVNDSVYINQDFIGQGIKVWRNGLFQYLDANDGVGIDNTSGKIIFRPKLIAGDRIFIESINSLEVSTNENSGEPPSGTKAAGKLYAGAIDNGDNTYILRWTTNARSLFINPRVLGIGSSTLAGYGLTFPDRMGDKINTWLANNTSGAMWRNLAVPGYTSANLLPATDGGIKGTNIDSALNANPDFIFLALASNDAGAGITVNQSIRNYRKLDSAAQSRGVPIFFATTQPRSAYNSTLQTLLKTMADSIRAIWPDRYVEAFKDVVDKNAATDGVIQVQYDNGDGIHLNSKGNQFIVDHLFERWADYFRFIKGVKRYVVDTSSNQTNWAQFDNITDKDMVKKAYPRLNNQALYFRVKAELTDGTFSDYSNIARLDEIIVPPPPTEYDHRILVDLGGDGVNTVNGSSVKDGWPAPSPDSHGNIWNNWFGKGGVIGFVDSSYIGSLKTAAGESTNISMLIMGSPDNGYGSVATRAINYTGFTVGVEDYPKEALYDNVFFYVNPNPVVLRIKGLSPNNSYYIKLWGARIDDQNTTPRYLQVKLGPTDWTAGQMINTRYGSSDAPEYNRAILFSNITGKDSVDLDIKVGAGSTFSHLSLIDIGIMGTLPALPEIHLHDTSTTLGTIHLSASVTAAGYTISSYQWSQVTGPNTSVIATPNNTATDISGLTNGSFVFRLTAVTSTGMQISDDARIDVYPVNNGKKTLSVYFSNTKAASIPGWLNAYGPVTGNFLTYTDSVTNWTIDNGGAQTTFWNPLYNANASDDLGTVTGNNSGIVPDVALQGYWYNYSAPYVAGRDNIIVSGLNPGATYTVRLVGSRSSGGNTVPPKYGSYHINGGAEILLDAYQNTSNEAVVSGVTPDSEGKIKIGVYQPGSPLTYGALSYLNALIIQEEQ